MKLSRMTILSAGLGLVCLAGCSSDLQKTNSLLVNENEDLRTQLGDRNSALAENEAQLREKDLELSRLRQTPEPYTQPPLAQVTAGRYNKPVRGDPVQALREPLAEAAKNSFGGVAVPEIGDACGLG